MTDGDSIAQLAAVVLLLMLAVPALATAHDYAGTPLGYEETATVDYTDDYDVAQNATLEGYDDNPAVTANGQQLVRGEDYKWNATGGTVTWLNSTNTTSGDTATIEYRAYQRTQETALAWTLISPLMALFGVFTVLASVRTLWSYIAEVWGL
jgi:hypothetical protein